MTSPQFGGKRCDGEDSAVRRARIIILKPAGTTLEGHDGETYADLLSAHKVPLIIACGGMGTCGKCAIRFLSHVPQPSAADVRLLAADEIASGWRLACQHRLRDGTAIEFSGHDHELREKASGEFDLARFGIDPGISAVTIQLPPPDKQVPDTAVAAVNKARGRDLVLSLTARRGLGLRRRNRSTLVRVIENKREVLDIQKDAVCQVLGLAVDIGTTTLAVYLFDLTSGQQLSSKAGYNPQRAYGADVIARIGRIRAQGQDELNKLHQAVVEGLNELIDQACDAVGASISSIYRVCVVGNPTMLHLFLGVSPVGIDHNPYAAIFLETVQIKAREIGLHAHAEADLIVAPGVSSYVGADLVAGILSTGLGRSGSPELLVDVGTNGEMAIAVEGRLISCSTAAGPAFEGAAIRQGMNALPGAIDDVSIEAGTFSCAVIGDIAARGICGTGLIGAIDELRCAGMIDATGKLASSHESLGSRLDGEGKGRRVLLSDNAKPVYLYQHDIREFQLGKAAIRAGIDTLLSAVDVRAQDLVRLYVAGAFGTHLKPVRALRTGLLPAVDVNRVLPIGNSAGRGAGAILVNHQLQQTASEIASSVEYIELSKSEEFTERYIGSMGFPDEQS